MEGQRKGSRKKDGPTEKDITEANGKLYYAKLSKE